MRKKKGRSPGRESHETRLPPRRASRIRHVRTVPWASRVRSFKRTIGSRPIDSLIIPRSNARRHSDRQINLLARSIAEFGWLVPVLVDQDDTVLAGCGRLAAARRLGLRHVPTIRVDHLTPAQKQAFAIADNRLAELSQWDERLLTRQLETLSGIKVDIDFEATGFVAGDLDYLESLALADLDEPEVIPELQRDTPAVSSVGDRWKLGSHRILCGSALDVGSYTRLLGKGRAQMVVADPPYNVRVDGHVCGLGGIKHRPFQMASGEMSEEQYCAFLKTAFEHAARCSADGAIHYIFMDWRHVRELYAATTGIYRQQKNLCIWNKTNAGMGSFYRSKHELVFVFKVGKGRHINNFGLGENGRYRTNVWDYPGINTFRKGRLEELRLHPTVKPTALVADAIRDCSKRGGIVLDPFLGSGTTLLAAQMTGRVCRGLELDPHYVDVAIGRWQTMTGRQAIHVDSGLSFSELASRRRRCRRRAVSEEGQGAA
ncbi:MAG: DNA methyltransferase [Reyranellaceae bacterium]